MEEKKTWDLLSAASIPLVMTLGNSMLIPVLPMMEKKAGITSFQTSLIITVYSIAAIILIPIAGFLSDRMGRKLIIIPSLIIAALGGLLSGWACWKLENPYFLILVGRFMQGVGAAGAAPIVLPLVGDMFVSKKDVSSGLGLIETSNTLGKVLSPVLGAFLASLLWFLPFFAFPVFCLISIGMVCFFIKTPKNRKKPQDFHKFKESILFIFSRNGRWLYSIFAIGGISMLLLFGILFYLSSLLETGYGLEGIKKGGVLAIPLAGVCIASFVAGKKVGENKYLMKWCSFYGLLVLTASVLAVCFTKNIYFLVGALFVSGAGIGTALPCLDCLITSGFDKEERGTISSVYSSMRFIGVAAGPPLFAFLSGFSHLILFIVVTALSVLAAILALFFIKPPKEPREDTLFSKI